jgi:hypothetical protein
MFSPPEFGKPPSAHITTNRRDRNLGTEALLTQNGRMANREFVWRIVFRRMSQAAEAVIQNATSRTFRDRQE